MSERYPDKDKWGRKRTPYAVRCYGTDVGVGVTEGHGLIYLTHNEYDRQMDHPDEMWKCPKCGAAVAWDDVNYEEMGA